MKMGASAGILLVPCELGQEVAKPWCHEPAYKSDPEPRHVPKTVAAVFGEHA